MIRTLGGSGRVLSEGQGEYSQRVRESTLGGSGRVLLESHREFSQREYRAIVPVCVYFGHQQSEILCLIFPL